MSGLLSPLSSLSSASPFSGGEEQASLFARLAEAEQARETAETASALKTRLLAFASHDLKSPLSSLRATCPLLESAVHDPEEIRDLARLMQAEVERMTRIVHDFLDRAALDAGALRFAPTRLDLVPLAERVVGEFALPARLKRQTLVFLPPIDPLPAVIGEGARLDQILANLLDNAIKYTPVGGHVILSLGHDLEHVWCAVEDSGPGISPDDLERVFSPDERFSRPPIPGKSAYGLGLVLAREIAALHGGNLTSAPKPGPGARFLLTLPRA